MAEWLKATDCKSVLSRVRRFESFSAHLECEKCGEFENVKIKCCITFIVLCRWNMNFHSYSFSYFHIITSGSSSFGRAVAFQASGGRFEPGLPLSNESKKSIPIDIRDVNESKQAYLTFLTH